MCSSSGTDVGTDAATDGGSVGDAPKPEPDPEPDPDPDPDPVLDPVTMGESGGGGGGGEDGEDGRWLSAGRGPGTSRTRSPDGPNIGLDAAALSPEPALLRLSSPDPIGSRLLSILSGLGVGVRIVRIRRPRSHKIRR